MIYPVVQDPGYALCLVGFTSIKCPSTGVKSEECISEAATSLFDVEDGLETLNAKSEGVGTCRDVEVLGRCHLQDVGVFRCIQKLVLQARSRYYVFQISC